MKPLEKLPPRMSEMEGFLTENIIEKIDELVDTVNHLTDPIKNKPPDWIGKLLNSEKFMKIVDEVTNELKKENADKYDPSTIQDLHNFEKESREPEAESVLELIKESTDIAFYISNLYDNAIKVEVIDSGKGIYLNKKKAIQFIEEITRLVNEMKD